jgi:putative Mg2+ transporter-C (MgtC) family protein
MIGQEQVVTRLALAALLGALVGAERERAERAAGLRTHALVGVGSCLFMLVSAFGFADNLGTPHVDLDPSRVAAQVASGIGFLGAGTIFLRRDTVRGLTTAASVWAVAAIGLAIGGGLYLAGVSATLLTLGVLAALKPIEQRVFVHRRPPLLSLIIDRPSASLLPIESTVEAAGLVLERFHVRPDGPSAASRRDRSEPHSAGGAGTPRGQPHPN